MADISKITIPSGTYDLKDAYARELIEELQSYTDYIGVTTTALTDGASTNPIVINGADVTAKKGNIVNYGSKEFIFDGTVWKEFGDLSALGALAYKDSAAGTFTPAGNCSGTAVTLSTTTVNSITNVGTLPTYTVSGETLTVTAGTLPTKGANTTVATGVSSVTQPTFTGTQGNISVS